MTLNEYQALAQRTSRSDVNKVLNGCMGMCGEAGECIDILKKHMMQGHELPRKKLLEELGDVMWYVCETASGLGASLDEVAAGNIHKLTGRYPDGFDADRSVNRHE